MKKISVKNYKNEKGQEIVQCENKFVVKPVIGLDSAK